MPSIGSPKTTSGEARFVSRLPTRKGRVTLRVKRDGRVVGEFPEATALSYPLHGPRRRGRPFGGGGSRRQFAPSCASKCRSARRVVGWCFRNRAASSSPKIVPRSVFLSSSKRGRRSSPSPPEALVETVARAGGVEVVVALPATRLELALAIVARSPSGPETKEAATWCARCRPRARRRAN
jgi:hypothetical protein